MFEDTVNSTLNVDPGKVGQQATLNVSIDVFFQLRGIMITEIFLNLLTQKYRQYFDSFTQKYGTDITMCKIIAPERETPFWSIKQ